MSEKMHKVVPETMDYTENKKTKYYPTFELDNEDLPDLKDFKVGEKRVLVLEVEQMSMRQGKEWQGEGDKENDKKIKATFKILKVGVKDESFEDEYARKRAGSVQ
jgi:hypothetical protein